MKLCYNLGPFYVCRPLLIKTDWCSNRVGIRPRCWIWTGNAAWQSCDSSRRGRACTSLSSDSASASGQSRTCQGQCCPVQNVAERTGGTVSWWNMKKRAGPQAQATSKRRRYQISQADNDTTFQSKRTLRSLNQYFPEGSLSDHTKKVLGSYYARLEYKVVVLIDN